MSKEVKGEAAGYTLLEAIDDGKVPVPGQFTFPQWQQWRKGPGLRPKVRVDGQGTTTAEEVAIWEAVMASRYGPEALEALADDEASDGSGELAPEARGRGRGSGVSAHPTPGATGDTATVRASAGGAEASLGEGGRDTGAGVTTPVRRPSRTLRPSPSNEGDSSQSGPVTPGALRERLFRLHDPAKETLVAYEDRVDRMADAMETLGNDVDWDALTLLKAKAGILQQLWELNGSRPYKPNQGVQYLKDMFIAVTTDDSLSRDDSELKTLAIAELVKAWGGRESSDPDKLFSTPSAEGAPSPTPPAATDGRGAKRVTMDGEEDGDGLREELSRMQAKLAALEIELAGHRDGSDAGSADSSGDRLAAALEKQTEALRAALTERAPRSTVTSVKADIQWMNLTDDLSDVKDVADFYENFEDNCAMANDCRGMSHREMLIALKARCRGSRLKSFQNIYRREWRSGKVLTDAKSVYDQIKSKHLVFSETTEEKELRVDNEHAMLMKGKLTAHQFEPLFEASITDLESIGLGKTPRELYLSYLRKVGPVLQKEIRKDRRLWPGEDNTLRGPRTWEEAHKVVLEYEAREATNKAAANTVLSVTSSVTDSGNGGGNRKKGGGGSSSAPRSTPTEKALADQLAVLTQTVMSWQSASGKGGGTNKKRGVCFNMRDHGSCKEGGNCKYSHDAEEVKAARKALKEAKGDSVNVTQPAKAKAKAKAKGGGKGGKGKDRNKPKSQTVCPFHAKGHCKKGSSCDMVHATNDSVGTATGAGGGGSAPGPVGMSGSIRNPFAVLTEAEGLAVYNPFADVCVLETSVASDAIGATRPVAKRRNNGKVVQGPVNSLNELPDSWWVETPNEVSLIHISRCPRKEELTSRMWRALKQKKNTMSKETWLE